MSNPTSVDTGRKITAKVYRFALYGASGSGKTVLLAALAMERINYHPNYTCTIVPMSESIDKSSGAKREVKSERKQALQKGMEALDRSRDALRQERMPVPTPPDHPDMMFVYDFSTGKRTYRIELIDYAGELVHSTQSANENAKRLREKLKAMDALLVIAPAPWPEDDHKALDEDLHSLQETFNLLRGEKGGIALDIPLAMLFTKWDRRSILEYHSPENEFQEMRDFLQQDPPPPHRELLKTLSGAISDPDNVKAFPVSALGESDKIQVGVGNFAERPRSFKPLRSFGLEDPFIWAAERTDAITLANYQKRVASRLKNPAPWARLWPFSLQDLMLSGRELLRGFPPQDPLREAVREAFKRVQAARQQRIVGLIAAFFVMLLISEFAVDSLGYRQVNHIVSNPQATPDEVVSAEAWFENYTESLFFRHGLMRLLVLRKAEADQHLNNIRHGREELIVVDIRNTANIKDQYDKALDYLEAFPNGKHRNQVTDIVIEYRNLKDAKAWEEIHKTHDPKAKYEKALGYEEDFPDGRHREEASGVVIDYQNMLDWKGFINEFQDLMKNKRFVHASRLLAERPENDKKLEIKQLREEFENKALDEIEDQILSDIEQHQYAEARQRLDEVDQWPPSLRTDNARRQQRELRAGVDNAEDQKLYQDARDYPSVENLQRYLNAAPVGSMKNSVSNYLEWLNKQEGMMDLKLSLASISWGADVGNEDGIQLTVEKDGLKIFDMTQIDSKASTKIPFQNKSHEFRARLSDQITLAASLQETDWWTTKMGTGERKVRVKELDGLALTIRNDTMSNTLYFSLSGIPNKPELPIWK